MPLILKAAEDDNGRRLDRILRKALPKLPLSAIHRLLRKGAVLVEGALAPADCRVATGQSITIKIDEEPQNDRADKMRGQRGVKSTPPCLAKKLEILYEGEGLIVINKAPGIAVHSSGGEYSLEEQVRLYLEGKMPPSLSFRPGPLHRLDKPSSGIIVFSTNLEGAKLFSSLMRERKIKKYYLALVEGQIKESEIWRDNLVRDKSRKKTFPENQCRAGLAKNAVTRVVPLAYNSECSLLCAEIETGRTHQIRAQAAARGHPLLWDKKYGGKPLSFQKASFMLHAWRMEIPSGTPFPPLIEAPLPEGFRQKIILAFGRNTIIRNIIV